MKTHTLGTVLFVAFLTLLSYSAAGSIWPPVLDPDPEIEPPKWDWQLEEPIQIHPDSSIKIYDIDMFENENSGAVKMLHDRGYKVICYIDVGSWEDWRDDRDAFPSSILGSVYVGYADERWLDIRDVNPAKSETGTKLATILEARFDRAMNMGCDAVEPDNMDNYDTTAHESSGFPLTYEDQIYFNLWVATAVHDREMLVGFKNDINQAHDSRIYNAFDFVVSEECFQYNECDSFSDFLAANKPVFETEYSLALSRFCPDAKALRISAIKKRNSLDAIRSDCSAYYSQPAPTAAFTSTCTLLDCTFIDISTDNNGAVTQWNWDFGDGESSEQQHSSHTYSANGTYTVRLTVTDDDGAMSDVSDNVTVSISPPTNQNPTATFSLACTSLDCTFTDTSTNNEGPVTAWNWRFGDGNSSDLQHPSHMYDLDGTYTVSLTVTNEGGATDNVSNSVTVNLLPPANQDPIAAFSLVCTSFDCTFTDTSTDNGGSITTWRWNFGDGSSTALQNPNHAYATEGTYSVSLTVTDDDGATNNVSHTVTIDIQSAPSTKVYYPNAVNITSGSYDWGTVASFLASDNDTYDIESVSISGSHTIDWYVTTTITEKPENITQIKMASIGQYSQAAITQNVYIYNFKDTAWEHVETSIVGNDDDVTVSRIIGTNVSHYISAQGYLRVRITGSKNSSRFYSWLNALYWEVTESAGGGTSPTNTPPIAQFYSVCTGLSCNVTDTSTDSDGSITGWNWNFGDSNGSIQQNPSHAFSTSGTYTVILTVTDDDGSTNSVSHSVTVSVAPPVNQAPAAAFTSACTNLRCDFTDTSSDIDGSIIGWNWNFGDSNGSTQQNPSHAFSTSGTYTVILTVTDDDGSTNSVSHSVTVSVAPPVNQAPIAAFTSTCTNFSCDFTDTSTDSDGSIIAWGWNFGDGFSSALQSPYHTYVTEGTYTISLTVTDDDGKTNNVSHTVTINTQSTPSTKVYYPNAVSIVSGSYDWGTMASLTELDNDTYDVRSASVSGGKFIDWNITTTISENPDNVSQIKVMNIGQYSRRGVSQNLYIYNFKNSAWELVDISTVDNQDDVTVSWVIGTDIPDYISAQGQLRIRITGFKNSNNFYSWSNALYWEVTSM